ncbi:Uncharacterized protein MLTONO_0375 [Mesorhizobium loti]|nr:Uncharacterized protein MLTONO_0375 [Mesorhizobium loti]
MFAGDLLQRGKSYYRAFQIVAEHDEPGLSYPTYFLLAHAIEVVLKSYLVATGTPKKALGREPFKHDVGVIFSECEQRGLAVSDQLMKPLALGLAHINESFDLRYPTAYILSIAGPSHCIPAVDSLIEAVSAVVDQCALKAFVKHQGQIAHLKGCKVRWSDD